MRLELTGLSVPGPIACEPVVVAYESYGTYTVPFPRPIGSWIGETLARAMGLLDHRKGRVRKRRASRALRIWRKAGKRRLDAHDRSWPRHGKEQKP